MFISDTFIFSHEEMNLVLFLIVAHRDFEKEMFGSNMQDKERPKDAININFSNPANTLFCRCDR